MSKSTSIIEPFPIEVACLACGVGAVTALSQNLLVACLCGTAGISIGILALRKQSEKFDKYYAWVGIVLSFVPFIYALILLIPK